MRARRRAVRSGGDISSARRLSKAATCNPWKSGVLSLMAPMLTGRGDAKKWAGTSPSHGPTTRVRMRSASPAPDAYATSQPGRYSLLMYLSASGQLVARNCWASHCELLADAVGHVAQQHRLGQGAGVVEVAGRRRAVLAGLDPFGVVADRSRDRRLRAA